MKAFRENTYGYPLGITCEKWIEIIDEMIFFHQYYSDQFDVDVNDFDWERLKNAGELFAKYYGHLWQ